MHQPLRIEGYVGEAQHAQPGCAAEPVIGPAVKPTDLTKVSAKRAADSNLIDAGSGTASMASRLTRFET